MTIRSGGRPRDRRTSTARPYDPDAYATETIPEYSEPVPRNRGGGGGGRGGNGLVGFLKFLVFALVLAAIVLAIALTALRPVVGGAVMTLAEDNPAALQLPFVKDIVREDLGDALVTPASTDPAQVEFIVEEGDTAKTIAARLEDEGLLGDRRTFVFIAIDHDLTGALQQGTFVLRKNMTPDQLVSALLAPPPGPVRRRSPCGPGCASSRSRPSSRRCRLTMDPQEFYELAKSPPATSSPTIRGSRRSSRTRRRARRSRASSGRRPTASCPTRRPRSSIRLMLDKFVANVGEDRLERPEGPRPDLLPGPDARLDRRARGGARRGAADHRRRLPEPDRRAPGRQEHDPQRGPDRLLRDRHDGARRSSTFDDWQDYAFWTPPGRAARRTSPSPRRCGLPDVPDAGPHPGPIATPSLPSIDAALEPDTADGYIYFLAIPDGGGQARLRQDRRRSTRRTWGSTATSSDRAGLARLPARLRAAADAGRPRRLGRGRPRGPAGRLARLRRAVRGRRRSTPTSASGREHMRYLTGFTLGDGEEKVAGNSGQFLVGGDEVVVLADSRYTIQARARGARRPARRGVQRPAGALAGARRRRSGPGGSAVEAALRARTRCGDGSRRPPRTSSSCRSRAGSRPTGRSRSRPSSSGSPPPAPSPTGRSRRCCPRSGRASPRPTSRSQLEWLMRTGGAEALAFDVACLVGPGGRAAARRARRPAGPRRRGPAVRLRRPGRRLPQRHDADAVRRRAGARATSRSTSSCRGPGGGDRRARGGRRGEPATPTCRADGRSTRSPAR